MLQITGILGYPVDHSQSPVIHNQWYQEQGLSFAYRRFPVATENLTDFFQQIKIDQKFPGQIPGEQLRGLSVTVPHKISCREFLDHESEDVKKIGACNTIVIDDHGHLTGHNTDWQGWLTNIQEKAPNIDWQQPITVLGAGGAAQAICYALQKVRANNVTIHNRTISKAETTAEKFGFQAGEPQPKSIIINATSLGLHSEDPLPTTPEIIQQAPLVIDLLYTPNQLQKICAENNIPYINGHGMLLEQAKLQHELFTAN